MNYIRHLNAFYNHVKKDDCLTSSHISLYMALFQHWNFNRFQNPFPVFRDDMMQLSKIGSKNTYHNCIKQLHLAKYIYYHSPISKFQPVKISMIRLDQKEEPSTCKQLDIFCPSEPITLNPYENPPTKQGPPLSGGGFRRGSEGAGGGRQCPNIDTVPVPILTAVCPNNDTVPVPKLGHLIKLNILKNKTVCNTPTKIFNKNQKPAKQINALAGVPKSVHVLSAVEGTPRNTDRSRSIPSLNEIQTFFLQSNYPATEAQKFFYYNNSRGWMLKDKVPIHDWQSLAHKWMLGIGKNNGEKKEEVQTGPGAEELYKRFSKGEKIFRFITVEHFNHLQLQLNETTMQEATKERINQLTGTNNFSINQLCQAYLSGSRENEIVKKDNPHLLNLAKRIAVLKHFQQQNCHPACPDENRGSLAKDLKPKP